MAVFACSCEQCRRDGDGLACYWTRAGALDDDAWTWHRTSAAATRAYDARGELRAIRYVWGATYVRVPPREGAQAVPAYLFAAVWCLQRLSCFFLTTAVATT